MTKDYSQYCPVCHALEAVGERWSLVIIRDLLRGPKRYTDLLEGLPGIGTNILASRLRDLEAAGVVRKTRLPPPAASTVYELTDYGSELEEVIYALGRWGARSLGPPRPTDHLAAGWLKSAFRATFDPTAARGVETTYLVKCGDEEAMLRIADGTLEVVEGPALADVAIEISSPAELFGLVSGELEPEDEELARFASLFSFAPRGAVSV